MKKKGTHEKHLTVLDFEKKEREKEVAELEAEKAQKQADKYQKRMNELAPMVKKIV